MKHIKKLFLIILLIGLIFSCIDGNRENSFRGNVKPRVFNCLIDSLTQNDTLYINYSSIGCFHFCTEEMKIYKRLDSLFVSLNISTPSQPDLLHSLNQFMNDSSIIAYSEFEKKGKTLKTMDACTTNENFLIVLRTDSIKFEDNGCEFEGYELLKIKLFGQREIERFYKEIYR